MSIFPFIEFTLFEAILINLYIYLRKNWDQLSFRSLWRSGEAAQFSLLFQHYYLYTVQGELVLVEELINLSSSDLSKFLPEHTKRKKKRSDFSLQQEDLTF